MGQFIFFNNFLSTSIDRQIASIFAESSVAAITDNTTRILYKFNIDTRLPNTKPYADIKELSYYRGEYEILIMLGSIFKIENVKYDGEQQMWIANLSLCTEDDYELKALMMKTKTETNVGLTSLGWLMYRQGEYEKAAMSFYRRLHEPSLTDFDKANCYRGLGAIGTSLKS